MIKKYKLENFEFSQNYLFFYDKLEKANYFLNAIYDVMIFVIDEGAIGTLPFLSYSTSPLL